jgi:putative flippase GtrA
MPPHLGQLARFIIAGVINTSFSYGIYALGLWMGLAYPVANFLAMVGGVCMGFVTQGRFVFRRFEARRFPIFVFTWLLLWGLNVVLIGLLMPLVGHNAYAAGAMASVVMIVVSFIVQKHLVFADRPAR